MEYGYVRVFSRDQHEDRQIKSLMEAGVLRKNIYIDKCSGKDFERPNYNKLVRRLKKGDIIVISSLDRLGRNYKEMTEQWRRITQKGISFVVLDMPILDGRNKQDLMGTVISELVLQLLSFVAETERKFIRQRQREGIDAARKRGVKFGRPQIKRPASLPFLKEQWERGDISAREVARRLNVSPHTAIKWLNE